MEELKNDNLDTLFAGLEAREKIRKRRYLIVTLLLIAVGVLLGYWTGHQSKELSTKAIAIESLRDTVAVRQSELDSVKVKLAKEKEARDQINIGATHASRGRFTAALKAYNKAIELDPTNSGTYALKGYLLLRKGDKKNALANLKHAVELDSTQVWHHYNLALAYWENGFEADAIKELRIIFSLDSSLRKVVSDDVQFRKFRTSSDFKRLMKQK